MERKAKVLGMLLYHAGLRWRKTEIDTSYEAVRKSQEKNYLEIFIWAAVQAKMKNYCGIHFICNKSHLKRKVWKGKLPRVFIDGGIASWALHGHEKVVALGTSTKI